jgi:lysophospholipase L1-like esterase
VTSHPATRARRIAANVAAVAFGLVVGLALVEVGLQIGAAYIRVRVPAANARWASERGRVVCLGDSNVYGLWMERDRTYPHALETIWNAAVPGHPVEVLNLGFPGLNSSKLRHNFRGLLMSLRPSLVLVLVGSNDINSVPVPHDDGGGRESVGYTLWRRSRLFRFVYMLATGAHAAAVRVDMDYRGNDRLGVVHVGRTRFDLAGTDRVAPSLRANWRSELQENLRAMAADATAADVAFVVLTYASDHTLYGLANRVITPMTYLRVIDVADGFARACAHDGCPELFLADQHPTAAGYELAAAIVFARLAELKLTGEPGDLADGFATLPVAIRDRLPLALAHFPRAE